MVMSEKSVWNVRRQKKDALIEGKAGLRFERGKF